MANIGKMNRRLTFQTRTLTKDAVGGRVETWVDAFKGWAEVIQHKANEAIAADAERSSDERTFRIYYRAAITEGSHRVLYQLKFYDITAVTEEGIKDRMLITCKAIQSLTKP